MKNILFIISFAIVLYSCTTRGEMQTKSINENYVVVLDLSDRLIQNPNQVNIDTSVIRAIFEKFEKSVQRNLVIKSKDRFSIRIIPQQGSSLPSNNFENSLSIDMAKYGAAEKLKQLNIFKAAFSGQLELLYQQAFLGNKNSNFSGVDIWQYFNEQINSDLNNNFKNKVVILTDGYFDFEDKNHGLNNGNLSTTTIPLLQKMKSPIWEKEAEEKNIGLMPVKLSGEATWLVCGIQSKNNKDLIEIKKLSYLWRKWLNVSGALNITEPILNSSSEKMKNLIANNL